MDTYYNRIYLGVPEIREYEDAARLSLPITIETSSKSVKKEIWYEVGREYGVHLYDDRVDPFVVALLPYCMKNGYDIVVDNKTGVSDELLNHMTEQLIPVMSMADKFGSIEINAQSVKEKLKTGGGVATGISRGVDSFYTILKTFEGDYKPTLLTLFNVQAYGEYGGKASHSMFLSDIEFAGRVCNELSEKYNSTVNLLTVESNIQEVLPIEIYDSGSFRDAAAVILIKQLVSLYYFSTTISLKDFSVERSCREFEPWLFYCLSTNEQRIQSYGADKNRLEKVRFISDYPITYKYLQVCRQPLMSGNNGIVYTEGMNCTYKCEKCRCTVLELIAVGKLNNYNKVFNTSWVDIHKKDLLMEVIEKKNQHGELDFNDLYRSMKQTGIISDEFENELRFSGTVYTDGCDNKEQRIIELMYAYFSMKLSGYEVFEGFKDNYKKVAIYGMGRIGKLLYFDIKDKVSVVIDRNSKISINNVETRNPDSDLSDIDLIIITTVYDEEVIEHYLKKHGANTVTTLKKLIDEIEDINGK
ncbi:hypothetical protein SAMN02910400_00323 [Lachnospiraceae bacterium C10]|nr:hypothetical protein SAMN02910400_00323 [Lachnospiraceae bacterium C10]